jgi:hypothetical protein
MITINVKRKNLSKDEIGVLKTLKPSRVHVAQIIAAEACIICNERVVGIYKKAEFDVNPVLTACLKLKFSAYKRESGIITKTINVQASPRIGIRDNACKFSKLKETQPNVHGIFETCGRKIAAMYRQYFSKTYAQQVKNTFTGDKRVRTEYIMRGTPFTGGVINKDTALPYHYDSSNTKNGISSMLILKDGIGGGELILPELNIGFACQDGFVLLFNGEAFLHGVTPILHPQQGKGYRYTIVYYNNSGMPLCLPPVEEEARFQRLQEERAEKMYQKIINQSKTIQK